MRFQFFRHRLPDNDNILNNDHKRINSKKQSSAKGLGTDLIVTKIPSRSF